MIHFEELPKEKRHFYLRHFADTPENPLGPIDSETGQPWKEYDATALVTIDGEVAILSGLLRIPPGVLDELFSGLVKLGVRFLDYERWLDGKKYRRRIPLR